MPENSRWDLINVSYVNKQIYPAKAEKNPTTIKNQIFGLLISYDV